MSGNLVDAEIDEIERHAIAKWLENGTALVCARCGGVYIPSRTSDPDMCGSCVPLRNLGVGDRSLQYAKCEHCGSDIRGKRDDAKYCGDSCRVLAYRKRKNASGEEAQDGEPHEVHDVGLGSGVIRKQSTLEEAEADAA